MISPPVARSPTAIAQAPDVARLLWARGVRAFGDGFVSLLLPIYLLSLGLTSFEVGIVASATLFGSGALTLVVGGYGSRFPARTLLLAGTALMVATGVGFAAVTDFWPLMVIAFVGTLNPSAGDVSLFLPLEHTMLAGLVEDDRRTAVFARYSLVGALAGACGALCAVLPEILSAAAGMSLLRALQSMFVLYAVLGALAALVYGRLERSASGPPPVAVKLHQSRRIVLTLAALFSLDAFGGGFIVQSMLALWLFQAFHLSTAIAGTIFFWTSVFSAFSYLVAVRIAERIGLVNTMVFTHLPSSLLLIAVPFVGDLSWVIVLLLVRSALSQMDVPTRTSYVMAVVPPAERPGAASLTTVPRSLAAASSPVIAGYLLGLTTFAWPLLIAGTLKITYDLLLLGLFRKVRPPEETARAGE